MLPNSTLICVPPFPTRSRSPLPFISSNPENLPRAVSPSPVDRRERPQCWAHGCNGREFSTFSNLLRHQREKSGAAAKSYRRLSKDDQALLRAYFDENVYPEEGQKEDLATKIGVTKKQISDWFANARRPSRSVKQVQTSDIFVSIYLCYGHGFHAKYKSRTPHNDGQVAHHQNRLRSQRLSPEVIMPRISYRTVMSVHQRELTRSNLEPSQISSLQRNI